MRHPFDGVNVTRRAALGAMAAGVAGLVGAGTASGQVATTLALGEEGGGEVTNRRGEAGATPALKAPTTEPFGEEAGKVVSYATPGLEDGGAAGGGPATKAKGEDGGPATDAINENGGPVVTQALNEAGGPLTRAIGEAGGPGRPGAIVPVKPASVELKDEQTKKVWEDMGDKDSAKGVQGCAILYGSKGGLTYLKDNLKADKFVVKEANEKAVAKMIADLDADDFAVREKAEKDLTDMGPSVVDAIEKAMKVGTKSAEQRMRLARVLEGAKHQANLARARRGLEVLVALDTAESKDLLNKIAKGDEKAWLTAEAKKVVERITPKK